MGDQSLETAVRGADNTVEMLREAGGQWVWPEEVSREYTNWIDEIRAVRETCVLADLSHHQMDQIIEGPDAMELLADLCTNSFEGFTVGKAKQALMVDSRGYFIGDGVLQRLGEEEFVLSGKSPAANWLAYHLQKGDYDATETIYPKSSETDDDPHFFTYQVQGPNALDVMTEVTDAPLEDVPFFDFTEVSIDGLEARALRHGMAGEPGFELQGPYEHGEDIEETVLEAGAAYGIRRLGTRAYEPLSVILGWVTGVIPPIYESEAMREYREWLPADGYEGTKAIGGSYWSDDVTDYYMNPVEMGYEHLIEFDHDFVGRAALEDIVENRQRTRVTLVWDDEDAGDIFLSMLREGTPHKFTDLPRDRWGAHYDEVYVDDDFVGFSKSFAYSHENREMLSQCSIDLAYADPGTEVTLVWGEEGGTSPNPAVEDHSQTEVRATVAPSPYGSDSR